jgi:DNA-binding LacI/PurR family transcriptional regulator
MARPTDTPTMSNVARLARCDVSTVSLALRDDARITAETKARVKAAAAELGYRINPLVSAWVAARRAGRPAKQQVALAYLTSHPAGTTWGRSVHFREILRGAVERAAEFGYGLTEFRLADYAARPEALNRVLVTRAAQGIIVGPTLRHYALAGLEWDRFALVTIGYALTQPGLHRVTEDHHFGMKLAFAACQAQGHRRIGLAITGEHHELRRERWLGAFLAEQHQKLPPGERVPIFRDGHAGETAAAWVRRGRPGVILADEPERWADAGVPAVGFAIPTPDRRRGVHENNRGIGRGAADLLISLVQRNERGLPAARHTVLVEPVLRG